MIIEQGSLSEPATTANVEHSRRRAPCREANVEHSAARTPPGSKKIEHALLRLPRGDGEVNPRVLNDHRRVGALLGHPTQGGQHVEGRAQGGAEHRLQVLRAHPGGGNGQGHAEVERAGLVVEAEAGQCRGVVEPGGGGLLRGEAVGGDGALR